jgi:hypothetical protein
MRTKKLCKKENTQRREQIRDLKEINSWINGQ